jgi:hypothetical protein
MSQVTSLLKWPNSKNKWIKKYYVMDSLFMNLWNVFICKVQTITLDKVKVYRF